MFRQAAAEAPEAYRMVPVEAYPYVEDGTGRETTLGGIFSNLSEITRRDQPSQTRIPRHKVRVRNADPLRYVDGESKRTWPAPISC